MGLIERCWLVTYLFPASLVSDLYIVLFDKIRTDPEGTPHGREGYYFGASGEHLMYDVCKAVAEVLVERGKGKSPEPTTFSQGDLDKYFNGVCPSLHSIQYPRTWGNSFHFFCSSYLISVRTPAVRQTGRSLSDGNQRRLLPISLPPSIRK